MSEARGALVLVLVVSAAAAGCGRSIVGRPCDSTDPCPTHFVCATAHDGVTRCMSECDLTETVCRDGTACLPLGTTGACYLGGDVPVGGACMNDLDCTRTAICISSGTQTQCRVGCNLDGTHDCTGGWACQPTTSLTTGFCATGM